MPIREIQFKKYKSYKNSDIEWVGDIPSHWGVSPGFTVVKERKEKNIGMKDNTVLSLSYGKVIIKPEEKLTGLVPESFETYQLVYPGDIIVRPTDLQNDKTSLRIGLSTEKGIITSAYINLSVLAKNEPKFYFYFLFTVDITKVIYGMGSGLRQNLSFIDFKRFKFLCPPHDEQIAIANFLDTKIALIDKAIAIKEKQIELLKERRQILIHRAVTRGLNPNVKMKDSGVEWIGKIPKHWSTKQAKYLIDSISNGTTEEQIETLGESIKNSVPVTRIETISDGSINMKKVGWVRYKKMIERFKLIKGDILFSHINSLEMVGKTAIYNGENVLFAGMNLLRIRPMQTTNAAWLHYYFKTTMSRNYFTSVAKPSINQASLPTSFIGRYIIVTPPPEEQSKIVKYIEKLSQKIASSVLYKEQEIEKLKEFKSSLVNDCVTGKIKAL